MTTTILLILSAALILTGVGLIWRDVHRKGRQAPPLPPEGLVLAAHEPPLPAEGLALAMHEPQPQSAWSQRAAARAEKKAAKAAQRAAAEAAQRGTVGMDPPSLPDGAGSSPAAGLWSELQPVLGAAVAQVNAVLAGAGIAVGPSGEPTRSFGGGYGGHRRILIAGESMAWLRLEIDGDGQLQASVKAHKEDLAAINATSNAPARGLTEARASDLLSECLKPAAAYAVGPKDAGGDPKQQASEAAWKAIDATVVASLKAANGALAQADARLVPLTLPAWDPALGHHRMTVSVEVFGDNVARMYIDRLDQEMEVAVGVADAQLADLGRRRRVPLQGITIHALAELIASCAWPSIARSLEARGRA